MRVRRIAAVHLLLTAALAIGMGVALIVSGDEGVHRVLVIPGLVVLLLIGFGGPVILGSLAVKAVERLLNRRGQHIYLVTYYALVALLVLLLYIDRNEPASGFAIFLLPWLPMPAAIVTAAHLLVGSVIRRRFPPTARTASS